MTIGKKLEPRHQPGASNATGSKDDLETFRISKAAKLFCNYKLIPKEAQPSEARDSGHPHKTQSLAHLREVKSYAGVPFSHFEKQGAAGISSCPQT